MARHADRGTGAQAVTVMTAKALPADGVSRRDFLKKAAIGLAAATGLSAALGNKVLGKPVAVPAVNFPDDSIFAPRADQRRRVTGG